MIRLNKALSAWGSPGFEQTLKDEVQQLKPELLPLQAGLSQTSHVSDSAIEVMVLNVSDTETSLQVKAGIFYAGIIAGSCCADDPTPVCEQTEHCEVQFEINKVTAETAVTLLTN